MVLFLGVCLLCAPAFYNGYPLLFSDLMDYAADGMQIVRKHWPAGNRPPFYGVAIWPFHLETSLWPVVIVQGLVMCHLLSTVLRAIGVVLRGPAFLALIAGLAIFTSLPWYVSCVMPDIFAGALVLSLFLLAFCPEKLTLLEKAYFCLLAVLSLVFHLSFVPVGIGILVMAAGFRLLRRRDGGAPRPKPLFALLPILLFLGLSSYVSLRFWGNLSGPPYTPPYLLAHVLVDGPGKEFLRRTCGERDYVLCEYQGSIPDDVEEFMFFQSSPFHASGEQMRIRAETGSILAGTARMFPLQTLGAALKAGLAQTATFGTEVVQLEELPDGQGGSLGDRFAEYVPFIGKGYQHSRQKAGSLSPENISRMNEFHRIVVVLSTLFCLYALIRCIKTRDWTLVQFIAVVCAGVLINGFVTGMAVGVFGRFGARVIWLLPFAAIAAGLAMMHAPRRVPSPARLSDLPSGLSG